MTWSIVARDPGTGQMGIAVASRFFAVGALVPHIRADVAVATQAFVNPLWGVEGVGRLAAGEAAEDVLADLITRDGGRDMRQAHMIDLQGQIAAFSGAECVDWAGHVSAPDISVAGNMLVGPQVVQATLDAYLATPALPFAERLLTAMAAGEAAGGDKRGRQSAALRIHAGQNYPLLDLRSDDHGDPLAELRRLLDVAGERYLHLAKGFATADTFSGMLDRAAIDAAIDAAAADRKATGIPSRSQATDYA